MKSAKVKNIVREMGPLIGLIFTYVVQFFMLIIMV